MKTSLFKKLLVAVLCLTLLVVFVGCGDSTTTTTEDGENTPVSRPTEPPLVDATSSVFVGSWSVSGQKSPITAMNFNQNGTADLTTNGQRLGGRFVDDADADKVTLTFSGASLYATYEVVDDNTLKLHFSAEDNAQADEWTMKRVAQTTTNAAE